MKRREKEEELTEESEGDRLKGRVSQAYIETCGCTTRSNSCKVERFAHQRSLRSCFVVFIYRVLVMHRLGYAVPRPEPRDEI